nr:MAG TPA: hypothetical protein [Caudoviricetes sp.]DAJ25938.1 MAG TPA: hypothetical protein [Caudoviricetes sp.]
MRCFNATLLYRRGRYFSSTILRVFHKFLFLKKTKFHNNP